MASKKFLSRIYSQNTYGNLQMFPLLLLLLPSIALMFVNPLIFLGIVVGYVIYVMLLKYGKMSYEQKYKVFRFIDATIYDIDWHKAIKGWIDLDISETYPLEIGRKDALRQKLREIKQKIEDNKKRRDDLTFLLKKLEKKQDSKNEKKPKKKEEAETPEPDFTEEFFDDDELDGMDLIENEVPVPIPPPIPEKEDKEKIKEKTEKETDILGLR